ncbi:phospholipid phosphatase 2-like isoform X2 [Limulus polyphemus]|uniref:Phospholipid phosphatase 2-like isoform X2 n=1 Tax=Limulus polyphemus TaxID=6850 RepID=A0ABM1TAE7_LIMPO|nr:phospholipid phosphatase 2-like isoform X2 [Limulus polyphemus]
MGSEVNKKVGAKVTDNLFRKIFDSLLWTCALVFICLSVSGIFPPNHSSFSCNDVSIQHPFGGDTIGAGILITTLIFCPILVFFITEAVHYYPITTRAHFQHYYNQCSAVLKNFLLGFLYVFFVTELSKSLVGELRPHFLDTCKPDWSKINCSQGIISEYSCTGSGPYWLVKVDIYKSFPSGHASLSFYTSVFVSLYVQVRIHRTSKSHLLKSWLQLLFLSWALVCSLTRISDYRHFWWDVLVGSLVGIVGGILTMFCTEWLQIQGKHRSKRQNC